VIPRMLASVTLDGTSDEPAWDGIPLLPVVMMMPVFGRAPTERTEILLGHDGEHLYMAGRLYDGDPDGVQANSRMRDSDDGSSDWFGIIIDSFNDNENALAFFTTPFGLRWDAAIVNDATMQGDADPMDVSWNTFWDVATARTPQGWFAEFRIPLSSLRFQTEDGRASMGIITWRRISRKAEHITFPAIPQDWGMLGSFKPSQARDCVLEGVSGGRPVYAAPYALAGWSRSAELDADSAAYLHARDARHELGLDVKYGITNNLTLDVTLNTDFAQVEADDEQINLTRFSLFFPEKRPFFLERASTFDFSFDESNRLFYSRRIGTSDGIPTRLYGGLRLVGRVGEWDLGVLNVQAAATDETPSSNFGVVRLRRRVLNPYSHAGGIATTRVGTDGSYNVAYGLDGLLRLFGDDYLTVKWAQTFASGAESQVWSTDAGRLFVNWERRTLKGLGYAVGSSYVGPAYDPAVGFEQRRDHTGANAELRYGWYPGAASALLSHTLFADGFALWRHADGAVESAEFGPGWEFESKTGFSGRVSPRVFRENVPETFRLSDDADVPAGAYTFSALEAEVRTPWGRSLAAAVELTGGTLYDGRHVSVIVQAWRASAALAIGADYEFSRVDFTARDQRFVAHVARLRLQYMPSTTLSFRGFVQYSSSARAVTGNFRLRYNPREGVDLYLVYDETLNTDRYRGLPHRPVSGGRTLMLKYTHTLAL